MKKGFTLIELLAVLVVLGLIGLLVYPAIEKTIKGVRTDLYKSQKTVLTDGLKNWVADHPRAVPEENGEIVYVSLGQLKIGGYVDYNLTNPQTDKLFSVATKVIIKRENNKYKYEALLDEVGLVEENKKSSYNYPIVEINGDLVTYLNVGDTYVDKGLTIDGNVCLHNDCLYSGDISYDFSNIDTSVAGSYYAKYLIYGTDNLVIYRTVIVR